MMHARMERVEDMIRYGKRVNVNFGDTFVGTVRPSDRNRDSDGLIAGTIVGIYNDPDASVHQDMLVWVDRGGDLCTEHFNDVETIVVDGTSVM